MQEERDSAGLAALASVSSTSTRTSSVTVSQPNVRHLQSKTSLAFTSLQLSHNGQCLRSSICSGTQPFLLAPALSRHIPHTPHLLPQPHADIICVSTRSPAPASHFLFSHPLGTNFGLGNPVKISACQWLLQSHNGVGKVSWRRVSLQRLFSFLSTPFLFKTYT